jgi:hypothetical protein
MSGFAHGFVMTLRETNQGSRERGGANPGKSEGSPLNSVH